ELAPSGGGEAVEAGTAAQFGDAPFGPDPALVFEAGGGRGEGGPVDAQHGPRGLLEALRDRPSVLGAGLGGAGNEEVERALEEFDLHWCRHPTARMRRLLSDVNNKKVAC